MFRPTERDRKRLGLEMYWAMSLPPGTGINWPNNHEDFFLLEESVYEATSRFMKFALHELPELVNVIPCDGKCRDDWRQKMVDRRTFKKRRLHLLTDPSSCGRSLLHEIIADQFAKTQSRGYLEEFYPKTDFQSMRRLPDVMKQLQVPLPAMMNIYINRHKNELKINEANTPPSFVPVIYPSSIDFANDPDYKKLVSLHHAPYESAHPELMVYDLVGVLVSKIDDSKNLVSWAHIKRLDGQWALLLTPDQVHSFSFETNGFSSDFMPCTTATVLSYGTCCAEGTSMNMTGAYVKQLWYRRRCLEELDLKRCKLEVMDARRAEIAMAVKAERIKRAALFIQMCERGRRARVRFRAVVCENRKGRLIDWRYKLARRRLWRLAAIAALQKLPYVLRIQAGWRGHRARQRAGRLRELKRRHDALEDAELVAAREKELARRRQAQQSREARQRELPAPLPSHAAGTTGNHGKKDGKDRSAVRSLEQAQEHADWTSEAGRQCRNRHGEGTKAEAHAAAVERKARAKAKAQRDKEIEAGKREAERLERWRLESRAPKSVDEALNEAAAYARSRASGRK